MAKQLLVTRADGAVFLLPFDADRVGEHGVEVIDDSPLPPAPAAAPQPDHPVASFKQVPANVTESVSDDSVAVEDRVSVTVDRPKKYKVKGWN